MREPSKNNVIIAVILNAVIPGTGYMYMGKVGLGLLLLVAVPFAMFATMFVAWIPWMIVMCIDMYLLHSKEKRKFAATLKMCPACAEHVQRAALICKHCRHEFHAPSAAA